MSARSRRTATLLAATTLLLATGTCECLRPAGKTQVGFDL